MVLSQQPAYSVEGSAAVDVMVERASDVRGAVGPR